MTTAFIGNVTVIRRANLYFVRNNYDSFYQ